MGRSLGASSIGLIEKNGLLAIGDNRAVILAKAQNARDLAKAQFAEGIDPSGAKQEENRLRLQAKRQTFEEIGEAFPAKQRKEGQSAATLSKTEYHLELAKRDFGRKTVAEITATMILQTLRKVEIEGWTPPSRPHRFGVSLCGREWCG